MSLLGMRMVLSAIRAQDLEPLVTRSVTTDMLKGQSKKALDWLYGHYREYGVVADITTLIAEVTIDEELSKQETPEPIEYYVKCVLSRAALNSQKGALVGVAGAMRARDPEEVHEAAKALVQVGLDHEGVETAKIIDLDLTKQQRLERYLVRKGLVDGVPGIRTPWAMLDLETQGLKPGAMWTLLAASGTGKTFCALIMAAHAKRQGATVGFVSPEMSRDAIENRFDAIYYGLPYADFLRGELDSSVEEYYTTKINEDVPEGDGKFLVAEQGRIQSLTDVELFVIDTKCDILVVDGMYLLQAGDPRIPFHERMTLIARGIKLTALKRNISALTTGQFNRNVRQSATSANFDAVGHSSSVIHYADAVLGMFQPEEARAESRMHMNMLKNREGQPIQFDVNWDMVAMNFDQRTNAAGTLTFNENEEDVDDDFGAGFF